MSSPWTKLIHQFISRTLPPMTNQISRQWIIRSNVCLHLFHRCRAISSIHPINIIGIYHIYIIGMTVRLIKLVNQCWGDVIIIGANYSDSSVVNLRITRDWQNYPISIELGPLLLVKAREAHSIMRRKIWFRVEEGKNCLLGRLDSERMRWTHCYFSFSNV